MSTLGRIAYETYCKAVDNKSVHGDPLPKWEEQNDRILHAWNLAALAVSEEVVDVMVTRVEELQ